MKGKVMSIIPIFIPHAGCPHQCVFCNQKKISGQKTASAEAVRQQIEKYLHWIKPGKENEAAFYGGSFTGLDMELQEELFKPVDKLLQEGIIGSVRLSTRPDYIDEERLALLKKHNVSTVELGVQSLDDSVLELAGRGHNAASVAKAVELLRAHGFKTGLQLMCGMPGQTAKSFMATVAESIALKPDMVRLYPLLVIKDTPLEETYRSGKFTPLGVDAAAELCAAALQKFTGNGINVIRIGLQPDDELCSPGNIVAGPFHPVMAALSLRIGCPAAPDTPLSVRLPKIIPGRSKIKIYVPQNMESKLRGQHNSNIKCWQKMGACIEVIKTKNTSIYLESENNE